MYTLSRTPWMGDRADSILLLLKSGNRKHFYGPNRIPMLEKSSISDIDIDRYTEIKHVSLIYRLLKIFYFVNFPLMSR